MSITKITEAEMDAVSIARLPRRPNEPAGFGSSPMTAEELQAAFDSFGRLNAEKFNQLVDEIDSGGLAESLHISDLDTLRNHVAELQETVGGDELARATEITALTELVNAVQENLQQHTDSLQPISLLAFTYNASLNTTGSLQSYYSQAYNRIFLKPGSHVNLGKPAVLLCASFPVIAGRTYYVRTLEDYPARYYANSDHISDGCRLRITVDEDGDGQEDSLFKENNLGNNSVVEKLTSEPVIFTPKKNGTATIQFSVYNNTDYYVQPWDTQTCTLTLQVAVGKTIPDFQRQRAYLLALDDKYRLNFAGFPLNGGLNGTYSRSEIDQKIQELQAAILALGSNV